MIVGTKSKRKTGDAYANRFPLPRLALPEIDEPGEIARYLFDEGLPGEFPFLNGAYREMYLEPVREIEAGSYGRKTSANGANGESEREWAAATRGAYPVVLGTHAGRRHK